MNRLFPRCSVMLLALAAVPGLAARSQAQARPDGAGELCLMREYDAAHLAAHPRQRVAAMLLWVAQPDPRRGWHEARIAIRFRGEHAWRRAVTECRTQAGTGGRQQCGVECDGGGFTLDPGSRPAERRLRPDRHGLELRESCEGGEVAEPPRLDPEPDDRLFVLRSAPREACDIVFRRERR